MTLAGVIANPCHHTVTIVMPPRADDTSATTLDDARRRYYDRYDWNRVAIDTKMRTREKESAPCCPITRHRRDCTHGGRSHRLPVVAVSSRDELPFSFRVYISEPRVNQPVIGRTPSLVSRHRHSSMSSSATLTTVTSVTVVVVVTVTVIASAARVTERVDDDDEPARDKTPG